MPRHCEGALWGMVKCRANSTTAALITVGEAEPYQVSRERAIFTGMSLEIARPAVGGDKCNEIGLKFSPDYYLSSTVEYPLQKFSPTPPPPWRHPYIFKEKNILSDPVNGTTAN
ncbi:hypothetical protein AVEN_30835-1 [Araneus ventricosus]|uniref:Uncharacterized protein n=1 Tax=Araneus ventricosus TaxID=182803 RepID=A0A4Y2PUD2_ARAVE|nr:hypothetical protein AVEN_30835-1 [Araneus ventricosus]